MPSAILLLQLDAQSAETSTLTVARINFGFGFPLADLLSSAASTKRQDSIHLK